MAKSKPTPSAAKSPAGAVHVADRVRMGLGSLPPEEADRILKVLTSGTAIRRKARVASRAGVDGRLRLVRVAPDLSAVIEVTGMRVEVVDLVSTKLVGPAQSPKPSPTRARRPGPQGKPTRV